MANRTEPLSGEAVLFGPYRLSASERLLSRDGAPVAISGRALDILIALIERAGEVVSVQELLDRVWPQTIVEEPNLRVHIATLRRVLGNDSQGSRYVINVPRRGYSIVTPLYRLAREGAVAIDATVISERQPSLPTPLQSMIGRSGTVAELSVQILSKRFISVIGPGGIGKTTVAVAVAHAVRQHFGDDSVFFVDLSSIADKEDVASAVAAAIGCSVPGVDPEPFILAFLANKHFLIVFDGCEHVIEAAAPLAARLVGGAPSGRFLATSREALRIEGEEAYLLSALEGPAKDTPSADEAIASPAIQLFMERATSAGYSIELSDSDAPIVADICRRLDGIPLAIELAASRVGVYGILGTADLLDHDAALQLQGLRSAAPRHRTLQAMLDWSFRLLSRDEQQILCMLSVFVGTFTWRAVLAVAGPVEAETKGLAAAVSGLVDKSLVSVSSTSRPVCYRLLDTTRIYAASMLKDRGHEEAVAERHASFFVDFLKEVTNGGSEFDGREAANYIPHLGNIRKALAWSFSSLGNESIGLELAALAGPLFLGLSQFGECQRWCRRAMSKLSVSERGARRELQLAYLLARSAVYITGDIEDVRAIFDHALGLSTKFQDTRSQLNLLADLNVVLTRRGDFKGALAAAKESATLADRAGGSVEKVLAEWMLGASYHASGDQAAALRHCNLGFRLASHATLKQFDLLSEARARFALARSLWLQGFPNQALDSARQAISQMARYRHHVSYCFVLVYTIPVFLWCGDLVAADELVEVAIAHATKYSLSVFQTIARAQKGELILANGDVSEGLKILQDAYREMLVDSYHIVASSTCCVLAKALASAGRGEEARSVLHAALTRAERVDEQCWRPDLLRTHGEILLMLPEPESAGGEQLLLSAIDCARKQSALGWELKAAIPLARMWHENARSDAAYLMLEGIYGRFTEGFATHDLTAARLLLEECRPSIIGR
ncbi:transcriptional regulator, winged helix family [Methylocella silvestris BL2]|uniref:Transcriptional regulator, winged helix family n=1 Tax=Methylocella silvestris (strain DSM 15510 / CIP 108128 / LMG 27833 / NCIMB 13906 / BL2) TaxID=395965 RepID=B8ESY3_METSB|nr:winged helix-turn-helix domain-containing protein [Methylocella silvestris]ACK51121.1 transcriptional regulator, winged helix family [Methylocella silvestris BL2]